MTVPKKQNNNLHQRSLPLQEKLLVREVREKSDRKAYEKIFRAYFERLHHFAYSYVGAEYAEDVVQSVFLKIWDQRECWDPPGTVQQYLFAAVRNEALNMLRHRKVQSENKEAVIAIFRELGQKSYEEQNEQNEELRKAIEQVIEELPPRCRKIFLLNRRSGLSYSEIARTLDISLSTVSTQMGRALRHFQKYLSDFLPLIVSMKFSSWFF
jgi:RNA polymerase sigma-70 factor (ECF subfamily)